MHLLGPDDLDAASIGAYLDLARHYAEEGTRSDALSGRIVATAFFEPSTRTRLSFEAAAHRLGADVIGFADAATTSGAKGETLEDTGRILGGFVDLLVMRHPEEGSAARVAAVAGIPVVNAGDGGGYHPTQTLVDLYTIRQRFGSLAGRSVAVVGDLRYGRTVHTLLPALREVGATAVSVPCPGLGLPPDLSSLAPETDLDGALASCDVVYATRVQRERFTDAAAHADAETAVRIDRARLEAAGFDGIVLHPLPRRGELAQDVDSHPAANYFEQARNGVAVRMAVLSRLLEESP